MDNVLSAFSESLYQTSLFTTTPYYNYSKIEYRLSLDSIGENNLYLREIMESVNKFS